MYGLNKTTLKQIDFNLTLGRIQTNVRKDFILAPHYSAIYANVGNELWDVVQNNLKSGKYEPKLPITIEVLKKSGLTRPGSILTPIDRFIYQALVDAIAPVAEKQIDRSKIFSNVLLNPDPNYLMFEQDHICWKRMQQSIKDICKDKSLSYAIKTDVASYFESLYQHNLINLLHSSGCSSEIVNLLDKVLLAWMEKKSHGILQGMFPSDFLGNFYLLFLDSDLSIKEVPHIRYVDDLYIFYSDPESAQKGLVDLCGTLRQEGLHLNESKTKILKTKDLLYKETKIDRMINKAREEIEAQTITVDFYGFQLIWIGEEEEVEIEEEEIELKAVESLYEQINKADVEVEKVERVCLPILSLAKSDIAIQRSLNGIIKRPHLTQLYCWYLSALLSSNTNISKDIEKLIGDKRIIYDWQLMWIIATLLRANEISRNTVDSIFRILRDISKSEALRGLCALVVGKHGNPGQRRNLKNHYSSEQSPYVRSAILFTTKYFPTNERNTCLGAWGGHSIINSLIAKAVKKLV